MMPAFWLVILLLIRVFPIPAPCKMIAFVIVNGLSHVVSAQAGTLTVSPLAAKFIAF